MTSPEAIDAGEEMPAAPGEIITVDGVRIHLHRLGAGDHTLVFDAGMGEWSTAWCLVAPELARDSQVVMWDRPGLGWSGEDTQTRSIDRSIALLRASLRKTGLAPPYVLVGHSMGGINMTRFARMHPDEVEGVVLVDPTTTDIGRPSPLPAPLFALAAGVLTAGAALGRKLRPARSSAAHAGETRAKDDDPFSVLPLDSRQAARAITRTAAYAAATAAEVATRTANIAAERASTRAWPPIPLAVLSSSGKDIAGLPSWAKWLGVTPERMVRVIQESHRRLAGQVPDSRWVPATNSGHHIQLDEPELVVDAVRWVLQRLA